MLMFGIVLILATALSQFASQKSSTAAPTAAFLQRLNADESIPAAYQSRVGVRRTASVRIERSYFDQGPDTSISSSRLSSETPAVSLQLFGDVAVSVVWNSVNRTGDGGAWVWSGGIADDEYGNAIFVAGKSGVFGQIRRSNGMLYTVEPEGGAAYRVVEVDTRAFPDELPPVDSASFFSAEDDAGTRLAASGNIAVDDGSTIDVLVLYTPAARAAIGTTSAVQQRIQLAVAETNTGYGNSQVTTRVRLVHAQEVAYTESSFSADLARLRTASDGFLDETQRLRDQYGADLVSLWIDNSSSCGLGYMMPSTSGDAQTGFSVVHYDCATGYYSFAHEMGHNMGQAHARDDLDNGRIVTGLYPYSYGYKLKSVLRTIMAYNTGCDCLRINYWSNPNVMYQNRYVTGISSSSTNAASDYLTINNVRRVIANYRQATSTSGGTDTTPPALGITSHRDGETVQTSSIQLSGTATDSGFGNNGIASVTVNGSRAGGDQATGANTANWSANVTLTAGTNTIAVVATDSAGNSTRATLRITYSGGVAALPRLVASNFTAPATGVSGGTVAVSGSVLNQSTVAAGAFRVAFYFSTDQIYGAGDVNSGSYCDFPAGLAANAGSQCARDIAIPASLSPGNWYVAMVVDDQGRIAQSDRSGNVSFSRNGAMNIQRPVSVDTTPPQLVITSHVDGQQVSNASIALSGTATDNTRGNSGIASVTVNGVRASNDTVGGAGTAFWTMALTLTGGANTLTVVAVDGNRNETRATLRITVLIGSATLPRLVVSRFTAPTSATAGGRIGIDAQYQNQGTAAAPPFRVGFYFSRDAVFDTNDARSEWSCAEDQGLAVGGTESCQGEMSVPATLAAGIWNLAVVVDDRNEVRQSDRSGNVRFAETGVLSVGGATVIDGQGPLLFVDSHRDGQEVTSPSLTLFGRATDAGRGESGIVSVSVNGSRASNDTIAGGGTANWVMSRTLSEGDNTLAIVASDGRSNSTTLTIRIVYRPPRSVDGTPPFVAVTSPSNGQVVTSRYLLVSGTATDAGAGNNGIASVQVNGSRAASDTASGSATVEWNKTIVLVPGSNAVTIVARDNAQNAAAVTLMVNYVRESSQADGSVLNFPHVVYPSELTGTGFAILNPTSSASTATFTLYGTAGDVLGVSKGTIPARGQLSKLASEMFPNPAREGWIQVTSPTVGLRGLWIGGDFSTFADGSDDSDADTELLIPLVTVDEGIYVSNPGDVATAMTLHLTAYDGLELGSLHVDLPAHGAFITQISRAFSSVPLANAAYVRISAESPIASSTLIYSYKTGPSWAVLNAFSANETSNEFSLPHVVNGLSSDTTWGTQVGIINLAPVAQTVTLTFTNLRQTTNSVQRTIRPFGALNESMQQLFFPNQSGFQSYEEGWIRITAAGPIVAYDTFASINKGSVSAVAAMARPVTEIMFGHIADRDPWWTGIALLNATESAADIEVFAFDSAGRLIGGPSTSPEARFRLPARTKMAKLIDEFLPAVGRRSEDGGFIYVRSTNGVPLVGLELFFSRSLSILANVPAVSVDPGAGFTPPSDVAPVKRSPQ